MREVKVIGKIYRDDGKIEHYDFVSPTKEKAIRFMEEVRKSQIPTRDGARAVGVVLRRKFWLMPWFAFYVSFEGREM